MDAQEDSCLKKSLFFLQRLVFSIPVYIVLGIIGMDYYSLIVRTIPANFNKAPFAWVLLAIVFNIVIILLLVSYGRCVLTSNFVKDHIPPSHVYDEIFPNCPKCGVVKPERTHHCSMCRTCILKMDHHCPWVANCVGFHNYKYFCLFIFWSCVGCFLFVIGSIDQLLNIFNARTSNSPFLSLFACILSFAFGITLIGFLAFHMNLVCTNQTTLEFSISPRRGNERKGKSRQKNKKDRTEREESKRSDEEDCETQTDDSQNEVFEDHEWRSPYDEGSKRANFEAVFGTNPWYWLLPVRTHSSTGFEFRAHQAAAEHENGRLLDSVADANGANPPEVDNTTLTV